jgi:hypothetical protein
MVFLDNHLITLNAYDGTKLNGTYLSNLFFPFKGLLKDDINILRSYVMVLNAQFPVSFYVIDTTNNVLLVQKGAGTITTITIPVGNYNSFTLTTAFTTAFTAAAFSDLTITINTINGILSFNSTSSYILYSNKNGSTISTILGFSDSNITVSGSSIALPYPLNLLGKEKLYINSSNLQNVAYSSVNNGFSSTIACVPVNVPPYSLIQYSCTVEQQKCILTNRVLDGIDIQILDTNNNFINFNNVPWSITLVLSVEKMEANKFHIQNFNNYLGDDQPIQPKEIKLSPDEKDLDLEFLQR